MTTCKKTRKGAPKGKTKRSAKTSKRKVAKKTRKKPNRKALLTALIRKPMAELVRKRGLFSEAILVKIQNQSRRTKRRTKRLSGPVDIYESIGPTMSNKMINRRYGPVKLGVFD